MTNTLSPRMAAWRDVFGTDEPPDSQREYLVSVLESSSFGGKAANLAEPQLVAELVSACGEELQDGISEFYEDGSPTELFYDTIRAFLDQSEAEPSEQEATEDEGSEEDDGTDERFSPVDASPQMIGLDALRQMIETGQLDLNPPWQRTIVWSPKKQKELIRSVLLGIPIPSIILHHENAGQLGKETYSIIDGKQRLTAISNYLNNRFKLPNFDVDPTHPLYQARGCYYDSPEPRRKSLSPQYRTKITTTQIPVLKFRDVRERRLREVFNLYNVTAVRLNAAEIRNAVYQNNPMHRMLFLLAGENPDGEPPPFLSRAEAARFSAALRRVLPNTKRFAALAFLCRYLGYSRAVAKDGAPFRPVTTAVAINRYFDLQACQEDVEMTGREIIDVFALAQDFFDVDPDDEEAPMAFFRWKKGKRKFEALQATTSMVCARVIHAALQDKSVDRSEVALAARRVAEGQAYPEKQQYATIWDHQARMVLALVNQLGLDATTLASGTFAEFIGRMKHAELST